jgi:hypothetical protein
MTALKNGLAIVAGFILSLLLTRGTDILLETTGIFPTVEEQQKNGFSILWMNFVAILYRIVFTVFGGYVTARSSSTKPMRNVTILGIVSTIIAIVGNIVVSQIPEMANVLPLWFSVALVLIAYPFTIGGGRFAMKNL